jgi:type VI secretion system protein ImpH
MAAEGGRDSPSLKELLLEKTGRFEFRQAVRLFRKLWSDREPVGYPDVDPRTEVVRFRSDVSSVFPASDVRDAVAPDGELPGRLMVSFFGVATPASWGSLPRRYAEEVRTQVRNKNTALRDFLDLFNHRFVSLFYRAAERNHLVLAYEGGRASPFERALYGVLGLGTPALRGRLPLDERMLLARGGLLAMRPMPATALAAVIRSIFHQPVEIVQFIPQRYQMEVEDQNRLGYANSRLGEDLYVGAEITLVQSKFRVRLGPLGREAYHHFLPDRPAFRSVMELVRFAVEEGLDFDLQLVLRAEEVSPARLGEPDEWSPRLGWSSWLMNDSFEQPADDALFEPASACSTPLATPEGARAAA